MKPRKERVHVPKRYPTSGERGIWYVYVIGVLEGCHKIGYTCSPAKRLAGLGTLPVPLFLVKVVQCNRPVWLERYLHQIFAERHARGEWFRLDGADLDLVKSINDGVTAEWSLPVAAVQRYKTSLREHGQFSTCKREDHLREIRAECEKQYSVPMENRAVVDAYSKSRGTTTPELLVLFTGVALARWKEGGPSALERAKAELVKCAIRWSRGWVVGGGWGERIKLANVD